MEFPTLYLIHSRRITILVYSRFWSICLSVRDQGCGILCFYTTPYIQLCLEGRNTFMYKSRNKML